MNIALCLPKVIDIIEFILAPATSLVAITGVSRFDRNRFSLRGILSQKLLYVAASYIRMKSLPINPLKCAT